jgi:cytochrome c biogenesis protein CcmG, thiol:disulfide interchange protein DsbE
MNPDTTTAGRRAPLRHAGRLAALGLVGAFVALLAYGLLSKATDTRIDDSLARNEAVPAPSFELEVLQRGSLGPEMEGSLGPALADGRFSSSELRGRPYVLNFWASWCVPCREEAPLLQRTWRDTRKRGVLFVGLNMQDVRRDAHDFIADFEIDYPNIRDPSNEVARRFGVTGIPETFFISASGDVVAHVIGVVSREQLDAGMAAAVSGEPRGAQQGGERRPTP